MEGAIRAAKGFDKRRITSCCAAAVSCRYYILGLGSQLALFEALNIQKSTASMLHAWLCNIFVHKSDKVQQKWNDQCRLVGIRQIERNSDALISSAVGSLRGIHVYLSQLASFEAAFIPSSMRGILLNRKENVFIQWLARCEACMCTSPQLASFEAASTLSSVRGVLLNRKDLFLFSDSLAVQQPIVHLTCGTGQF